MPWCDHEGGHVVATRVATLLPRGLPRCCHEGCHGVATRVAALLPRGSPHCCHVGHIVATRVVAFLPRGLTRCSHEGCHAHAGCREGCHIVAKGRPVIATRVAPKTPAYVRTCGLPFSWPRSGKKSQRQPARGGLRQECQPIWGWLRQDKKNACAHICGSVSFCCCNPSQLCITNETPMESKWHQEGGDGTAPPK